jgi:TIR domain-containing protein
MSRFRIRLPSTLAGRYVRYILGFGVGVGVGMAPFLGKYKIPLFEPLLGLFPEESKVSLIPTSAFLMGLVAVAIQFYSGEEIQQGIIGRRFRIGFPLVILALAALYALYNSRVLQINDPKTGSYVPYILGWSRLPKGQVCTCISEESDLECAYALGLDLRRCWPSIPQVQMSLHLLYLTLTGGFGTLIGLLLLQEEARQQQKEKQKSEAGLLPLQRKPAAAEGRTVPPEAPLSGRRGLAMEAPAPPPEAAAAKLVAQRELERKRAEGVFDVFLCHNSDDKPDVKKIGKQLMERGILPWLDEWELPPGQPWQPLLERQIANIKSAAVFVGSAGVGPWQEHELRGFLSEFVSRQSPVIPVLLRNAPDKPELPLFLRAMTWVDFRIQDSNPLDRLIWGITGKRPERLSD